MNGEEKDDRVDRIGRLIGRVLSAVLAIVLLFYLWHTYIAP